MGGCIMSSVSLLVAFLVIFGLISTISGQVQCQKKREMTHTKAVRASLPQRDVNIFASGHSPVVNLLEESARFQNPSRPLFWSSQEDKSVHRRHPNVEGKKKEQKVKKLFAKDDPRWKRYETVVGEQKHNQKRLFPHGDERVSRLSSVPVKQTI